MLLWLHTYFSLNSVLLCAAFTYRDDQNIDITMEMGNINIQGNKSFKDPVEVLQSFSTYLRKKSHPFPSKCSMWSYERVH